MALSRRRSRSGVPTIEPQQTQPELGVNGESNGPSTRAAAAAAAAATALAENQRPMYAIPTEGWMKQPDSWRYGEDVNQTLSMRFKPREPTVIRPPDTRRVQSISHMYKRSIASSAQSSYDHRLSQTNQANRNGLLAPPHQRPVMPPPPPLLTTTIVTEPQPMSPPSPSKPSMAISSRRRLLSVAALTGPVEPVYPPLNPSPSTSTTVSPSRFYS